MENIELNNDLIEILHKRTLINNDVYAEELRKVHFQNEANQCKKLDQTQELKSLVKQVDLEYLMQ